MTRISSFTGGFSGYRAISRSLVSSDISEYKDAVMLFAQTAAPTGWTKLTTDDDCALRVVSGSVSSGGTVAFSSVFSDITPTGTTDGVTLSTVGNTTLSTPQMGLHNHIQSHVGTSFVGLAEYLSPTSRGVDARDYNSGTQSFGGGSHTHPSPGSSLGTLFTGTPLDFKIKYVDVILATRN